MKTNCGSSPESITKPTSDSKVGVEKLVSLGDSQPVQTAEEIIDIVAKKMVMLNAIFQDWLILKSSSTNIEDQKSYNLDVWQSVKKVVNDSSL